MGGRGTRQGGGQSPVDEAAAGDVATDNAMGARGGGETARRGRGRVYVRKRPTFAETAVRGVPAHEAAPGVGEGGKGAAARREAALKLKLFGFKSFYEDLTA